MCRLRITSGIIYSIIFKGHKPLKEKCAYEIISNPQERSPRNRYSLTEINNRTLKLYLNSRSGHCLFNTESKGTVF